MLLSSECTYPFECFNTQGILTWLISCILYCLLNLKNHLMRLQQPCLAWGCLIWVCRDRNPGVGLQLGESGLLFASLHKGVNALPQSVHPCGWGTLHSLYKGVMWSGSHLGPWAKEILIFTKVLCLHLQVWEFLKHNLPYHRLNYQTRVPLCLGF